MNGHKMRKKKNDFRQIKSEGVILTDEIMEYYGIASRASFYSYWRPLLMAHGLISLQCGRFLRVSFEKAKKSLEQHHRPRPNGRKPRKKKSDTEEVTA